MPQNGAYILEDLRRASRTWLRYECECGISGVAKVMDLIREYGPEARLPDLRKPIAETAGCAAVDGLGFSGCKLVYVRAADRIEPNYEG